MFATEPVPVKSEKVADGVWYITGVNNNSALIEMKDYLIVVEAPHGERRSLAVLGEVKKLVPNKPIKYLVNTHHHFDHASGVRTYAAEGVTIVTHEVNRPYFERAALNSWTLAPDRLAKSKKKPVFQTMGDNMVLTDGTRSVELYQIVGNPHHDGIIMAYLRKEKLLIEADVYTPARAGAEPPKVPNPQAVNLEANVRRLASRSIGSCRSTAGSFLIASCSRPSAKSPRRQKKNSLIQARRERRCHALAS